MEHLTDDGYFLRIDLGLHAQVDPVGADAEQELTCRGRRGTDTDRQGAEGAIEQQFGYRLRSALLASGTVKGEVCLHRADRAVGRLAGLAESRGLVNVLPEVLVFSSTACIRIRDGSPSRPCLAVLQLLSRNRSTSPSNSAPSSPPLRFFRRRVPCNSLRARLAQHIRAGRWLRNIGKLRKAEVSRGLRYKVFPINRKGAQ